MALQNIQTLLALQVKETATVVTGATVEKPVKLPNQWTPTEWTEGTAANQVNLAWTDTRSYNTTGTTLDLAALTAASTNTGAATFAATKVIRIQNNDATNSLVVGAAASTPHTGPLGGTAPTVTIPPGGEFMVTNRSAAGWTTTSANNLKLAASASTVNATVSILGLD